MATQAQIDQAMRMARAKGYKVSVSPSVKPANEASTMITEGPRERSLMENARIFALQENQSTQERISQLEMENRLLKAQVGKPTRQSLVESNSQTYTSNGYQSRVQRTRNQLAERVERYGDLRALADRESPLPDGFQLEQAIRDFGWLYAYKTGLYTEE